MFFGNRRLGRDVAPLIVAELSGNHNGSIDRALAIVDAAADSGAHAIKLQTYTPDTMTLDSQAADFRIDDPKSLWHGRRLFELYAEAATPWEWHEPLFERARKRELICFSTPFDQSAIDFLETFDPPAYKIASFELTDLPLISAVSKTGRPLIMSTGMATHAEINEAVETARKNGATEIVLLKCTSNYPASPKNSNVATIADMREEFACEIGLSDHTGGVGAAVAAIAFGAVLIEKHLTLRREDGGVDSAFSLEPHELASLVSETHRAWEAIGTIHYGPSDSERPSLAFRRSIYVSAPIVAGESFTPRNIRVVRPGYGLAPREYSSVLGKRARIALAAGERLTVDAIE